MRTTGYLCTGVAEAGVGLTEESGGSTKASGRAGLSRVPKQPPRLGGCGVPKQPLEEKATSSHTDTHHNLIHILTHTTTSSHTDTHHNLITY